VTGERLFRSPLLGENSEIEMEYIATTMEDVPEAAPIDSSNIFHKMKSNKLNLVNIPLGMLPY